jgi:multiple antibiotic resistance protein
LLENSPGMTDPWNQLTQFAISLFALLNPFAAIPYVLGAAAGAGARGVLALAASATATMLVVLLSMHFVGEVLLVSLGTTLASFQIGGGLVIVLTGLSMLRDPAPAEAQAGTEAAGGGLGYFIRLGVAPLGIPMLAGAGAITKVILETHPSYGVDDEFYLALILVGVCLVSGLILSASAVLMRLLGPGFFAVLSRLAGLVIVAVGVEVMARGVLTHVRQYAGA